MANTPLIHEESILILQQTYAKIFRDFGEPDAGNKFIVELLKQFYNELKVKVIADFFPAEDKPTISLFLDGCRACIATRSMSTEMLLFTYNIAKLIQSISNNCFTADDSVSIIFRVKSLASELLKILNKALGVRFMRQSGQLPIGIASLSPQIRDTFGIRVITKGDDESKVFDLFKAVVDIIAGQDIVRQNDFIEKHSNELVGYPFAVVYVKNYITSPRENGYKTLQFTLECQPYAPRYKGFMCEVQLRTATMDWNAVHGNAAHTKYKSFFGGPEYDGINKMEYARLFNRNYVMNMVDGHIQSTKVPIPITPILGIDSPQMYELDGDFD